MTDMRLVPADYDKEVARELVTFFHSFYRFGAPSAAFDLRDAAYLQFLHNLLLGSLAVGAVVFVVLCVRRCILNIRSAFARRARTEANSTEITAVILLTFLAISSLSGLLGEAQIDYSAGVVRDAMTNTSDFFADARAVADASQDASKQLSLLADEILITFSESELPEPLAFQLSGQAVLLRNSAAALANQTDSLLPSNYSDMAREWELDYFMLKSTTNGAILAVALASFLSIASIGWAMVAPLRFSVIVILSVVPISHTLIGAYLAATMMTADFCAAPLNSTLTLLDATPTVEYYVACPANATTLPFADATADLLTHQGVVSSLHQQFEHYAESHGAVGARMKQEFLNPIGAKLQTMTSSIEALELAQSCKYVSHTLAHAAQRYCEYGMIGFFSMWGHQILLCVALFVCVVATVIVYERVHIREIQHDMRYQLLSSYEEDDMEHVYLSSD